MLVRVESAVAVGLVLLMLSLASYNVIYRNVLAPLQFRWAHSGPPVEVVVPPQVDAPVVDAKGDAKTDGGATPPAKAANDDFGGFSNDDEEDEGDDEGETKAAPPKPAPVAAPAPAATPKPSNDEFGGFTDDDDDDDEAKTPATKPAKAGGEDFGGFGGDDEGEEEGDEPEAGDAKEDEEEEADDLGENERFTNLAKVDAPGKGQGREIPRGGPPPEGSFAAWAVGFIDDVKLDWIDILVRQLVILVAFFGAMLATTRRKHINVDAFSRLLGPNAQRWLSAGTNALATFVCVMLMRTGAKLVAIGREYPAELLPWAEEWMFQLMYPICFGLLAFHFGIRSLEHVTNTAPVEPPAGAAPRAQEAP